MNELQAGDGLIPVNAAGIPWWFPAGDRISLVAEPRFRFDIEFDLEPLQAMVHLEKLEGGAYHPVAARVERSGSSLYLVSPEVPWLEGERYRLSVDANPEPQGTGLDAPSPVAEIEIVEAFAGEQLEPIELTVSELVQSQLGLFEGSGSCAKTEEVAYLDIEFPVPAGAPQWPGRFLQYTTIVNGNVWSPRAHVCQQVEPGGSWTLRTGNRVAATCDPKAADGTNSLYGPSHIVRMEARLPGSDVVVHSEEVEVELTCSGAPGTSAPEAGATRGGAARAAQAEASYAGCSISPTSDTRGSEGARGLGWGSLLLGVALWRARARRAVERAVSTRPC